MCLQSSGLTIAIKPKVLQPRLVAGETFFPLNHLRFKPHVGKHLPCPWAKTQTASATQPTLTSDLNGEGQETEFLFEYLQDAS